MKLGQIASPQFQMAFFRLSQQPLPGAIAYRMKGAGKIVAEESEKFFKTRIGIIDQYCEKDEQGNRKEEKGEFVFNDVNKKSAENELKDLENIEVELPAFKLSELGNRFEISAADATALEGFITE